VSDRVFVGADVDAALETAARTLGLPRSALRYVVLDPGGPGGRGLSTTPAQVAVLLPRTPEKAQGPAVPRAEPSDPTSVVRALVEELARTAGLEIQVSVDQGDEAVAVAIGGADRAFFFGPDDTGGVLRSLEHLLQAALTRTDPGGRVVVSCEGFAARREEALRRQALELAERVREDRQPRTTAPLNSFERRLVHLALSDQPGIVTYSVGEGADRRVTVALEAPPPAFSDGDDTEP
jgi:spoIIIJ-associated protein